MGNNASKQSSLRRYLLFPVALFFVYFAVDKTCLLPRMKALTQPDATYLYYDYKTELLDELETVYKQDRTHAKQKKFLLVLGSSRLMFFDYASFKRNYPDWELFNFSCPVTMPAYYSFLLQRVLERGIKPDLILVETDPFQFNDGTNTFLKSNVTYSLDLRFVLENWPRFTRGEVSHFIGRRLFAGLKYPPNPEHLIARLRDPQNKFGLVFAELDKFQRENRGAGRNIIPKEDWFERDFARLEATSRTSLRWIYGNYKMSDRQWVFLEQVLDRARNAGVQTILIRPPVSRPMQRMIDTDLGASQDQWRRRLSELRGRYAVPFLDLSARDDYYCNTFVDGSHMSIECYHPLMVLAMSEYRKLTRGKP
ncbi:MAG: DUF1574 domain-containing protein [Spirochaetia bacterium]|nr:DUF1574 domain-containing protein [Spirochaetia bacterium]